MLDMMTEQGHKSEVTSISGGSEKEGTALAARISQIRQEAEDILSFEFVRPNGGEFPAFSAGSHIHVYVAEGLSRQYSLCNDPSETHRYVIGVLKEENGRGGSKAMHELEEGQEIYISRPENHFQLADRGANFHLLLAGGIGVTPMMAMIEELERRGASHLMHYCTRSSEKTAFMERLEPRIEQGTVILHHDLGDPQKGLDIAATLAEYEVGTHLYACGPPGFMQAVNSSVGTWPPHVVHQEYFTGREMTEEEKQWDAKPFKVSIIRTGQVFDIPAEQSIVTVLREHGFNIQTDCEEGYCGTCLTRYVEGEPVHRDTVLDDSDREDYVMICCARSRSKRLVLDL